MLADYIAKMIEEMLNESGGTLELQRNEMANRLGCVPSQISYVISSRFTPMNANFGIVEPLGYRVKGGKTAKNEELAKRALEALETVEE